MTSVFIKETAGVFAFPKKAPGVLLHNYRLHKETAGVLVHDYGFHKYSAAFIKTAENCINMKSA
jgi:hypothetical protein